MNVCVYQTSGGKDITQPLLPETKAIVLLILEQLQKDGFEFLYTKPVLKNSKPKKIKEIKRNNVRLLYFVADNTTYITNIISNKQKNKLEKQDKELAEQRMKRMLQDKIVYEKTRNLMGCLSIDIKCKKE